MVSGHQAPAFTVASLATTTAGRPSILPTPVTTPAAGACAVVPIVGDQQADLLKVSSGVEKLRQPLARRQLAGAMLLFNLVRPAARPKPRFKLGKLFDKMAGVRSGGDCGWVACGHIAIVLC